MRLQNLRAGAIAGAATLSIALLYAGGAATAQDFVSAAPIVSPAAQFIARPVVQPVEPAPEASDPSANGEVERKVPAQLDADSLAHLVASHPRTAQLSPELNCLAGAIYFEAKSESLEGQLAVGRVVVARSKSGRFPGSYCGVVYQPSQFSFIRGRSMPGINKASRDWQEAAAIAQIADSGEWRSPVEGALFFHASHVSPNWRLKRMARVDNHVFYR